MKLQNNSKKSIALIDVKVSLLLSVIKLLHAKWIVDLHHHLKVDKEMTVSGFRAAKISEKIKNTQNM